MTTTSPFCSATAAPGPSGPAYSQNCQARSVGESFEVAIGGAGSFSPITFPSAGKTASDPVLTSPPTTAPLAFGAGDQTITFPAFTDTDMTMELRPAGGTTVRCKIPPGAGTFTIPNSAFGSATTGGYTLYLGTIKTSTVTNQTLLTVTQSTTSGTYTRP